MTNTILISAFQATVYIKVMKNCTRSHAKIGCRAFAVNSHLVCVLFFSSSEQCTLSALLVSVRLTLERNCVTGVTISFPPLEHIH